MLIGSAGCGTRRTTNAGPSRPPRPPTAAPLVVASNACPVPAASPAGALVAPAAVVTVASKAAPLPPALAAFGWRLIAAALAAPVPAAASDIALARTSERRGG